MFFTKSFWQYCSISISVSISDAVENNLLFPKFTLDSIIRVCLPRKIVEQIVLEIDLCLGQTIHLSVFSSPKWFTQSWIILKYYWHWCEDGLSKNCQMGSLLMHLEIQRLRCDVIAGQSLEVYFKFQLFRLLHPIVSSSVI